MSIKPILALAVAAAALAPLGTFAQTGAPTMPFDTSKVTLTGCTPSIHSAATTTLPIPFGRGFSFDCTVNNGLATSTPVILTLAQRTKTDILAQNMVGITLQLMPNQATTTRLYAPAVFKNGAYHYTISLAATTKMASSTAPGGQLLVGVPFGNTISFAGVVSTPMLKIAKASFDKKEYAPGDTGTLTLTVASSTTAQPYYVNVVTKDEQGNTCSTLLAQGPLTAQSGSYPFAVSDSKTCVATALAAEILSSTGYVMDSKSIAVTPFGGASTPPPTASWNQGGLIAGVIALVVILLLGALFVLYRKRPRADTSADSTPGTTNSL